jgi:GT2 family glycosyltransferase
MTDFSHEETREVDWILGACILVRREAIDKAGLLDEDLFLYFGDVAWAKKFKEAGYKVYYFADTNIVHYHKRESASSGIFSRIFWIHISDWLKYLKKYS